MRSIQALTLVASFFAAASAAAQPSPARPTATPTGAQAVADVQSQYSRMEHEVELQYARLMKEAKNDKESLEDKIKEIEKQIEHLKQVVAKIELVSRKIEELLPKILAGVGTDSGSGKDRTPSTVRRDQLAARLEVELGKAGIRLSPEELRNTSDAILENRFGKHTADDITKIRTAISGLENKIKAAQGKKAVAQTQIEKLPQDRDKTLADLRARKQEAIKVKESELARAGSAPTPTRTPIVVKSGS